MQSTKQKSAAKPDDERGENLLDHLSASEEKNVEEKASEQTHFGFKQVAKAQKQSMVADVFHSVAAKYDVMNDLMSLGIHRIWKRYTIDCSGIRRGQKVLDLAGGTGQVTLADINHSMLLVGKEKLTNMGIMSNLNYVQANAEALPFPDNHFDLVTMAFGLRNVTEKSNALASIFRVLKPGGCLLVLEFSKPSSEVLSKIYDTYSFHLLPKIGQLVANDAESYQYLAESIRMHPDQDTLEGMMKEVGFEQTSYTNLTAGIVALHRGFKF